MESTRIDDPSSNIKIIRYGDRFPNLIRLMKIDRGENRSLPPAEESCYSLCYCSQGWQTWYVGKTYCFLPADHFLFVKPGDSLTLSDKTGPDSSLFLLCFTLPREADSSFLGYTRDEWKGIFFLLNEFSFPLIRPVSGKGSLMDRLYTHSLLLAEEDQLNPILNEIRVRNLYRELFLSLAEGEPVFSNALDSMIDSILPRLRKGGYSPLVEKAIGHMSTNLYDGLTLISLADDVNISLSRFKALFKGETGLTPLEYYTRLSIQKSLELLHNSNQSVRSIAGDLGFSSAWYFSSVFSKTVGMGPEEFREWEGRFS
jgi:AraC-like DNA-binding protein